MQTSRPAGSARAALAVSTLVAVVLLAVVPAFACTPRSMALIDSGRGEAGSTVTVSGTLYDPQYAVVVKFGGTGGPVLATSAVLADGSFSVPVTIPATAEAGKVHVLAVYQPDDPQAKVSNVTFEVPGAPAPAAAPEQPVAAASPAPVATATPLVAAPATPAVAPVTQPRVRPAPAAATPASAAAAVTPAPEAPAVSATPAQDTPAVAAAPADRGAPSLADNSGAAGAGRSAGSLMALIAFGFMLMAAATAIVVREVRRRRSAVKA